MELELPRLTTFPAYKGTDKGGRPRCSRCHIPIADLRQGYVRAVLDSLPVWAGEDVAETKVALLIFPPCCFSYANMNSTSSRVLCFCPVFVLFCTSGSEAVLRFACSSLRWQKLDLFFFLFFFPECILSNTLNRWIHVPVTKSNAMKSRPAFTLNIPFKKKSYFSYVVSGGSSKKTLLWL